MIAARVIRIIWAMITKVSVIAGKVHRRNRSARGVASSTFANVGRIGQREPNIRIKTYATKNSGNEIVVKDVTLTILS